MTRRTTALLSALTGTLLVSACDLQALSPGDRCWWVLSKPALVFDTVKNTTPLEALPDSLKQLWRPYMLVGRQTYTDSVRTCR